MVARDHSVRVILIFYAPTCMRVGVIAADSSLGTDELVEADGEVARGSCCQRAAGEGQTRPNSARGTPGAGSTPIAYLNQGVADEEANRARIHK